jgi:hypothetical protein
MANSANLVRNEDRTPEERRENAKKAGIASGEARREKADLRKLLEIAIERVQTGADGNESTTGQEIIAVLIAKALDGDMAAIKEIFDRLYGKPKESLDANVKTQNKVESGLTALYAKIQTLKK